METTEKRIKKNSIQCVHCGDILVSTHVHDFRMCTCGKVGVDGGNQYLKRIGYDKDRIELSVIE